MKNTEMPVVFWSANNPESVEEQDFSHIGLGFGFRHGHAQIDSETDTLLLEDIPHFAEGFLSNRPKLLKELLEKNPKDLAKLFNGILGILASIGDPMTIEIILRESFWNKVDYTEETEEKS